jgi:hypothetical protein
MSFELIFETRVPDLEVCYFLGGPERTRDGIIALYYLQYITKGAHNLLAVNFDHNDLEL